MSVRPFYISADIEGRKTELTGGPRRKDGYMNIEITQREMKVLSLQHLQSGVILRLIKKSSGETPKLCTSVYDSNGDLVAEHYTDY